ncbi:amidohydrolase family protein [Octadecabacter sp. 1_MG-2023]|uniref:amidohydrolase family protein n=1 Tax=unclassified Octadecabacter TaxID=196158 RepID=UPI001C0A0C03|nr:MULTISPECIES: amidohydrolase family protein [unclassified Octadecabacter]MBU2994569.1 amidohydrolase family protein [Octadecabacter sp. B2R22]MDO6734138.1 amidohydrolase family protein [Octadecabacter sp. 1_MG-2023]
MIVDAHQHFWQLDRGDYGWLTPDLAPLYRDFMPDDLTPILSQHDIDGTILVQAAPTIAETEFLLQIADQTPFVLGVVGWTDFEAPSAASDIDRLARNPKLVGLRPMIQDIAEDDWMLRPELTPAFEAMIEADLTFDALVLPRHLPYLRQLLSRHPNLRTVIDHGAKPDISKGEIDDWANDIAALAKDNGAYCKLSGLLTEAGKDWTPASVAPYVAHLFDQFGPRRLVWGSDWPVLTLAAGYETWIDIATSLMPDETDQDAFWGGNAAALYKI